MVEIRTDRTRDARAIAAAASLSTPIQRDESFDPVEMDGGTTILRYNVRSQADVETLKRQPGVVAVWTDTPIEPMTPR